MTTIANNSINKALNTVATTQNKTVTTASTASTATTSTTSATGSSASNPFVLTDAMNWVPWEMKNRPQFISYQGNVYKFDMQKDASQMRYKALNDLGNNRNMLYISFTGQSRDEIVGYKTEKVQVGTQKVQIGTQKVQVGTEKVQTGTKKVKVGEKIVGTKTTKEPVSLSLGREIDSKNATGAIGDMLTRGTTQLSDASQFFKDGRFTSYQVGSLTGENNQVTSGSTDPFQQKLGSDDMFVAGDPEVGGKGNGYKSIDVIPNAGYMTMLEDGSDTGRKVTINSHPAVINDKGNKAFTEYGFVVQDDAGKKTTAALSGGKLKITGADGAVKTLAPGETYTIGSASDPVGKFYYASVPGGENGTNEQRLVFDSYEKPSQAVIDKLTQAGMSATEAAALRTKSQATFGFRIPDGKGSYRSSAGVSGNALPTTTNNVKTYYDAHFYKPDGLDVNFEKCIETPIKEDIYEECPIYEEKPKYEDRPIYKETPVYENKKTPIYGKTREITKNLNSPLVLDLDGKGIQTTAPTRTMDIAGDGTLSNVSWFGAGNGVLAFDANKNGKIDINGKELFGNNSDINGDGKADSHANGFEALKKLASNTLGQASVADGVLDASEIKALENKAGLRIITSGDKSQTLSSLRVSNINLGYSETATTDQYGNQTRQVGSFQRTLSDGSTATRTMADVWLLQNAASNASAPVVATPAPAASAPTPAAPAVTPKPATPSVATSFLQQLRNWLSRYTA
jgi:hypothetical protein